MSALTQLLNPSEIAEVVAFLRELALRKDYRDIGLSGICLRLYQVVYACCLCHVDACDAHENIMKRAQSWPSYSGNLEYPVPSTCCRSPEIAYGRLNLWGPTKYGDLRRSLCAFLADHIEKYPDFDPEREAPTREAAE